MSLRAFRLLPRRLLREQRGTALTEFGLIAPAFFILLIGVFDIAHTVYARSIFVGAVEKAAREAALETGDTDEADAMVASVIRPVLPGVTLVTERSSYFDFADIGRAEKFTDVNGNDVCDNGEAFIDENGSGEWEEDIGQDGNGGAGDVVMYTVTANYSPLFKVPFAPQRWNERSFTTTAVKKNQPFGDQLEYASTAGTCVDEL